MADSTTNLDTIAVSQASKEVTANALFDAGSPATLFGRRASTCVGLTWGYYGGTANVAGTPTTIANGTVSLTASDTNYVEANSSGVVSANIVGFTAGAYPLYEVVTGTATVSSYTDKRVLTAPLGSGFSGGTMPVNIQAACSDETTALSTGDKLVFRMPHAMTLTEVRASLTTASSSGVVEVDIRTEAESPAMSLFSTTLTIDANEKTSTTAATPAVISYSDLGDDDELIVSIAQAGTAAAGLKITLIGTRSLA